MNNNEEEEFEFYRRVGGWYRLVYPDFCDVEEDDVFYGLIIKIFHPDIYHELYKQYF